jgi:hypothetical protein
VSRPCGGAAVYLLTGGLGGSASRSPAGSPAPACGPGWCWPAGPGCRPDPADDDPGPPGGGPAWPSWRRSARRCGWSSATWRPARGPPDARLRLRPRRPVNGVLHLAGVAGDGMVHFRDPADAAGVLRPKVHGTLAVVEALAAHPPWTRRLLLQPGRGRRPGRQRRLRRGQRLLRRVRTVLDRRAWTPSASTGRAGRRSGWRSSTTRGRAAGRRAGAGREHPQLVRGLDPAADPVLDEHRVDGQPVLPGTGHLDWSSAPSGRRWARPGRPSGSGTSCSTG